MVKAKTGPGDIRTNFKIQESLYFFFAAAFLVGARVTASAAPPYTTNQSAVAAVGQQNLTFSGVNGTPGVSATGLASPNGVWTDGIMLIVADTTNHRVLIYNTIPAANSAPPDVVVGQQDVTSNNANQGGGPGAATLSSPTGVFFDGNKLYIADSGNNRVLIFNSLPSANNANADVVVGQAVMGAGLANQGAAAPGPATLSRPVSVYSDGIKLYIADQNNHRVLVFNAVPTSNGLPANIVVGQPNKTSGSSNQGSIVPSTNTLSFPNGVFADVNNKLYVSDTGNNRVLIFNAVPSADNTPANVAVGQVFFSSSSVNQKGALGSNTLSGPAGVFSDGTRLIVADQNNSRVLIYNTIPNANNAAANVVVGQVSFSTGAANQGGTNPTANTLSRPAEIFSDGVALYVADVGNNRVLIYSALPGSNNSAANIVVGQNDMNSGGANQISSPPTNTALFRPSTVFADRTHLFIADRFNSRILIYNSFPTANNAAADVVVGQANMTSGSANQGAAVGANTLSFPGSVYSDGTRLFVADRSNNRILIYNTIPTSNNAAANVVIGQPNFTSNGANQGAVSPSPATLNLPSGVFFDGSKLYIADTGNSRVLIYNSIPAANNAGANTVVGQVLMSSGAANQGFSVPGQSTLFNPAGVYSDGTKLYIADQNNNRILIYNAIPNANGAPASAVLGQVSFSSNAVNQAGPVAANTLNHPGGMYSDGSSLYVVDQFSHRILIYNPIPAGNNASASVAVGQTGLTSGKANQSGSVGANTLSAPSGVIVDSTTGRMFVADGNNNRILLFLPSFVSGVNAAGGSVVLNSPMEPLQVQAQIPPGAFSQAVNVTISALSNFSGAPSNASVLSGTGIGFQIGLDQPVQPAVSATLFVTYQPSDLANFDKTRLVISRFDDTQAVWVPLVTFSDTANNRVIAQTNHFSTFQIMQANPQQNTIQSARAFPNPLFPSSGQPSMTFSLLPVGARIRIYNLSGVLIRNLSADGSGMASWDATNQYGTPVGSGVYFVFAQAGGDSRVMKVAISR